MLSYSASETVVSGRLARMNSLSWLHGAAWVGITASMRYAIDRGAAGRARKHVGESIHFTTHVSSLDD